MTRAREKRMASALGVKIPPPASVSIGVSPNRMGTGLQNRRVRVRILSPLSSTDGRFERSGRSVRLPFTGRVAQTGESARVTCERPLVRIQPRPLRRCRVVQLAGCRALNPEIEGSNPSSAVSGPVAQSGELAVDSRAIGVRFLAGLLVYGALGKRSSRLPFKEEIASSNLACPAFPTGGIVQWQDARLSTA